MMPQARSVYTDARNAHAAIYNTILRLQGMSASMSAEELADTIYALREASKLADDTRKELNRLMEQCERLACVQWMQGDGGPIRTEYCVGSPDVKQTAATPRKGTEEYAELMKYLGVPLDAPVAPHWPSVLERISKEMAEGKPLPPGCDPTKQFTVFKVTVRKKKPVLEEDAELQPTPNLLRTQSRIAMQLAKLREQASFALALTELSAQFTEAQAQAQAEDEVEEHNTEAPSQGMPAWMSEEPAF